MNRLANDPILEMGNARRFDRVTARPEFADVLEQPLPTAEQDRNDIQLALVLGNPSAPARARSHLGPAAGIEPATLCLLGSRSTGLSYAGIGTPPRSRTRKRQASQARLRSVSRGAGVPEA